MYQFGLEFCIISVDDVEQLSPLWVRVNAKEGLDFYDVAALLAFLAIEDKGKLYDTTLTFSSPGYTLKFRAIPTESGQGILDIDDSTPSR